MDLLALDQNPTFIRPVDSGQNLDQGGFPGTVFPQKHMDFSRLQVEVNAPQRNHSGKSFDDALHLDQWLIHFHCRFPSPPASICAKINHRGLREIIHFKAVKYPRNRVFL